MITRTTRRFWGFFGLLFYQLVKNKSTRKYLLILIGILVLGMCIPQKMIIPVEGGTTKDWNENSFWAYPWGSSVTHKGIDIFKARGTHIFSSTHGIVLYTYEGGKGGKSVMVLGPKWRFHYYAHLDEIKTFTFKPLKRGTVIGTVGDSGNAVGKPPHLHYAITTPIPYFHRWDSEAVHGWKKIFYLNPDDYLRN